MKNLLSKLFVGFGKVKFYISVMDDGKEWMTLPFLSFIILLVNRLFECSNFDDLKASVIFEKSGKVYQISIMGGVVHDDTNDKIKN